MSFIFFGSNQFSVIVLKQLIAHGFTPDLIVTVPDAPAGRKQIITPPAIKQIAQQLHIPVIQPASLKKDTDVLQTIQSHQPQFGIVAAYGKIIPQNILDAFPEHVLNVHPSLLPTWRGPSPIETAIKNGDAQTGITVIQLDALMDHGPIAEQVPVGIKPDEYFLDLYQRLAIMGGDIVARIIPLWLRHAIPPQPQDESRATFSKMLSLDDGRIDIHQPIDGTYNQIRAFSYEPGCWMELPMQNGQKTTVKIITAHIENTDTNAAGLIVRKDTLGIAQGNRMLAFDLIQPQGKNPMKASDFLRGNKEKIVL